MFGRVFRHRGLEYEFKSIKRTEVLKQMPPQMAQRIELYFQEIKENHVPNELFEDPLTIRCSEFRIAKLGKGVQKTVANRLIENGYIGHIDSCHLCDSKALSPLLGVVSDLEAHFKKAGFKTVPQGIKSHGAVLNKLLLSNDYSLAIEIPVWTWHQTTLKDYMPLCNAEFSFSFRYAMTGHIDLLLYDYTDECLTVVDYKPEGNFLRSIPQVASYGLLLKHILRLNAIKCVSFSEKELWVYNPTILQTALEEELIKVNSPRFQWRKVIAGLGKI